MSAIRPNMNFDNERQEHTPYQNKTIKDIKEVYNRIMKADPNQRIRPRAVKNHEVYTKWFNTK